MTFDTLQNTSECHEVPRLPRETHKLPLLENLPEARPYSNRADGCEWLRTVGQREPLLRIRERKGKEGNGRDRKGKEGKGMERTGKERKERERKGKKGKERQRKGKDGKGRERKGKDGKGREGRERKEEVDLEISRRRMTPCSENEDFAPERRFGGSGFRGKKVRTNQPDHGKKLWKNIIFNGALTISMAMETMAMLNNQMYRCGSGLAIL